MRTQRPWSKARSPLCARITTCLLMGCTEGTTLFSSSLGTRLCQHARVGTEDVLPCLEAPQSTERRCAGEWTLSGGANHLRQRPIHDPCSGCLCLGIVSYWQSLR